MKKEREDEEKRRKKLHIFTEATPMSQLTKKEIASKMERNRYSEKIVKTPVLARTLILKK